MIQSIDITNGTTQQINITPSTSIQNIDINPISGDVNIVDVLVNDISVVRDKIAYIEVPIKTSDLINDGNGTNRFATINEIPVIPPSVQSITTSDINNWNSKQDRLIAGQTIKNINNQSILTSGNINIISDVIVNNTSVVSGGIANITVPTKTSDITNDSLVSDVKVNSVSVVTSGVASITVPTKTSDITNDSDYISGTYSSEYNEVNMTLGQDQVSIPTTEVLNDYYDSDTVDGLLDTKQNLLISGTNIKTINNQSILGSGNIDVSGGGTTPTDVRINGTSITSDSVADIKTESSYNSVTNKIATINDVPTKTSDLSNDSGYITSSYHDNTKQDVINDLSTIRSGASLGITSIQPNENISELTNNVGYITSYTESDPIFTSSPAYTITNSNITNWNNKSNVSINRKVSSGTNILDITINGTTTQIYAPTSGGSTYTAGDGITISNNEISAKVGTGIFFNASDEISLNNATQNTLAEVSNKEDVSNKTTDLSNTSTDTEYPSAKCTYDEIQKARQSLIGTVLYDNASGTSSSVTLIDSCANYDYLEIYYSWAGNTYGYKFTKIYNANGKSIPMDLTTINNNYFYVTVAIWLMNGTSFSQTSGERWRFGTSGSPTRSQNTSDILVHKIVGYNE